MLRGCYVERSRQRSECRKLRHRSRGVNENVLNESLLVSVLVNPRSFLFSCIFYCCIAFAFRSSFSFIFFLTFFSFPLYYSLFFIFLPLRPFSPFPRSFLFPIFRIFSLILFFFFLHLSFPFPDCVHFFFLSLLVDFVSLLEKHFTC